VALIEELPPTYSRFMWRLTHYLTRMEADGNLPLNSFRLVALLFARPDLPLAKEEIIPSLPYYHVRSGRTINFYCAGYKTGLGFPDDVLIAQDVGGYDCFFSTERFNEARSEITAHSTWEYSGGCDLILANAGLRMNPSAPSRPEAYLDFSTALSVNLEKMKAEHAIDSVAGFFEQIIKFTEKYNGSDPTWGFSDAEARTLAGSALKSVVLSLLPKSIRDHFKQAFHFAVRDIHARNTADEF
jgi:hypothetical protein